MARGPGVPAGLSAARIARAALELADEAGLPALTIRGVARRLQVEPMSIYNHLAGKGALLDAVWDEVLSEGALPADHPAATWQEYLRDTAFRYREALLAHPKVLPLMLERYARTPQSLDLVQTAIAGLTTRGVPLMVSVDMVNVISMLTIAHALSEHRFADVTEPPPLDPERHALLAEIIARSMDHDPAEDDARRFRDAIDALVKGYAARLETAAPDGP